MSDRPRLHSVQSMALSPLPVEIIGPAAYQSVCVDAFVASQVARGFSQLTIDNGTGVLERFLAIAGKPAWDLAPEDIDLVMAALIDRGVGTVTRRGYVGTFNRGGFGLEFRKALLEDVRTIFVSRNCIKVTLGCSIPSCLKKPAGPRQLDCSNLS